MSLFEELIEGKKKDKQIVKSFETKENLSDQIFGEEKGHFVMRDEIKKRLIEISNDFIESLGVEFFIHDVVLTGSLANYNWSQYSDIDLHVIIDFEESKYEMDILKEFFDAKKNVWNEKHDIKIKGYDVEIYVQDINEPHISSGVYSVLHNKWEIEPKKETPNIDDRKILEKGEDFAKKIDYLTKNPKEVTINQLEDLRKKIKEFRQSGLESGGEYSYENLTFKLLRRNGYIQKLLKLKTQLTDKKLSITQ
jgi:predicted nucleotidyltransferase